MTITKKSTKINQIIISGPSTQLITSQFKSVFYLVGDIADMCAMVLGSKNCSQWIIHWWTQTRSTYYLHFPIMMCRRDHIVVSTCRVQINYQIFFNLLYFDIDLNKHTTW